ncbi:MAG: hypothetical protein LUF85_06285 [Bacteroides sp.]|nr:hypothetical protein [Bacteroides sp.]
MTTKYSNLHHFGEKSTSSGPEIPAGRRPVGSADQDPDTSFSCGCSNIPASMEDVMCGCIETDVNAFHKDMFEREIQLDREKRIGELDQMIHDKIGE